MNKPTGFTLIEVLITTALFGLIVSATTALIFQSLNTLESSKHEFKRVDTIDFIIERIDIFLNPESTLVLPLNNASATSQNEAVRSVLSFTLSPYLDYDNDGIVDADNDKDGAINEDPGNDMNNDLGPGIVGIDDDLDGNVDEGVADDDDEDGSSDEDTINYFDDDNDNTLDEDVANDMDYDGAGTADADDDNDGVSDEDWYDTVTFFLETNTLKERIPTPNATSGTEYSENIVAENVTEFQVTRIPISGDTPYTTIQVVITVDSIDGESTTVQTSYRLRKTY